MSMNDYQLLVERFDRVVQENYRLKNELVELANDDGCEFDKLEAENARLREALEKIAVESNDNNNFKRSEDEAQYYINVAKVALAAKVSALWCTCEDGSEIRCPGCLAKEPTQSDECHCGHKKRSHIYEEGACRPGFECEGKCERFKPVTQKDPKA